MTSGFDDEAQWSVPVTQLAQLPSQHAVQLVSLPPQQARQWPGGSGPETAGQNPPP